jgi:hypothetical protein
MKRAFWALMMIIVSQQDALAAQTSGHAALALGVIVGEDSPHLTKHTKTELARLLDDVKLGYGPHPAIAIKADSVVCQAGDVDIAAFNCKLTFGAITRTRTGRAANEVFATLVEAGVQSDGAAGHIFEAVHKLDCKLDPAVIAQKGGGGADCSYDLGPS